MTARHLTPQGLEGLCGAVRQHAHQRQGFHPGWRYVAQQMTDAELATTVAGARTEQGAIRKVATAVRYV